MDIADFWIPGFMPLQFLLLFAVTFVVGIWLQRALTHLGWRITTFWQVVLCWTVCYLYLKVLLAPPLPWNLFANYMGAVTIALFIYAGATEGGWTECKDTVLGVLGGRTQAHRIVRVALFVTLPALTYINLRHFLTPNFETPIELRNAYGAPPRTIVVHGEKIDLQTTKNPFRVGEGLKPPASEE